MKGSTKNRVRGKARELKGKVKSKAGKMSRNPELEDEGLGDQIMGKAQNVVGRIQQKLED